MCEQGMACSCWFFSPMDSPHNAQYSSSSSTHWRNFTTCSRSSSCFSWLRKIPSLRQCTFREKSCQRRKYNLAQCTIIHYIIVQSANVHYNPANTDQRVTIPKTTYLHLGSRLLSDGEVFFFFFVKKMANCISLRSTYFQISKTKLF